ncbi:hypothetical protein LZK98_08620 [Sphingomonas cannabina]|uniref:hypothetical protein n=1 Tax=Sphingomonas cannabina TaxID=2899123 RepID=UPI001F3EA32B|nr:hypothetical protein [Sphingomonas cannabina]UIJ46989.1 hypothetical protein LZK98_08620 [Sphingomonas cannabina]
MSFKGFGWVLGIATVLPACYMVTSAVASERGRVESVDRAIVQAKRDIRSLETEFETRASLAQLERYNGEVLALTAPRPEQYLASDTALASLQPLGGGQAPQYASLVVPSGIQAAQPQTAAVEAPAAAPAPARTAAPAAVEVASNEGASNEVRRAVAAGRAQAVAMLDHRLISESTLGDVVARARSETAALR